MSGQMLLILAETTSMIGTLARMMIVGPTHLTPHLTPTDRVVVSSKETLGTELLLEARLYRVTTLATLPTDYRPTKLGNMPMETASITDRIPVTLFRGVTKFATRLALGRIVEALARGVSKATASSTFGTIVKAPLSRVTIPPTRSALRSSTYTISVTLGSTKETPDTRAVIHMMTSTISDVSVLASAIAAVTSDWLTSDRLTSDRLTSSLAVILLRMTVFVILILMRGWMTFGFGGLFDLGCRDRVLATENLDNTTNRLGRWSQRLESLRLQLRMRRTHYNF